MSKGLRMSLQELTATPEWRRLVPALRNVLTHYIESDFATDALSRAAEKFPGFLSKNPEQILSRPDVAAVIALARGDGVRDYGDLKKGANHAN